MKKYIAFISYSRKDKMVADWLHNKLEHYILPDRQQAEKIFPFKDKYFRPVFLDTQDLHIEERPFTENLQNALRNASFLIVICSRNSAVSPFVDKEINYFLRTHDQNFAKIVPIFIDEVTDSIPPAFKNSSIMTRHFPIYNSKLFNESEANKYCFYQIVSYILGLDFATIYNRYEIESVKNSRKRLRILSISIGVLILFVTILGLSYYNYRSLVNFEKKVFPQAVVHGYERNFLTPVIKYLKQTPTPFKIYVLLPQNERDLTHQDRVEDFIYNAKVKLGIDSITYTHLPTESKRGNRIMQIMKNGKSVDRVYLDFATTTTSFLDIAEFKKRNKAYKNTPTDSIIVGYSKEFMSQTKEKLKSDSTFVKFFLNKEDLIDELGTFIVNN